jgi:hypothetical protein
MEAPDSVSTLMGTELQDQEDKSELVCEVCHKAFTRTVLDPVLLPCFHTFCKSCITQNFGKTENQSEGGFACWRCDAVCSTSASHLPINFERLADVEAESVCSGKVRLVCQECDNENAGHYCPDCSQLFCESCRDHHKKATKSKNHDLLSIAEYKASLKGRQQVIPHPIRMCKKHKNQEVCVHAISSLCASCGGVPHHRNSVC